jgi:hypothetical protein
MSKSTAKAIVTRLGNAVVNARPRLTAWSEENGRFQVFRSVGSCFIRCKRCSTWYRVLVRILADTAVAARFQERFQYFRRRTRLWAGKVMFDKIIRNKQHEAELTAYTLELMSLMNVHDREV